MTRPPLTQREAIRLMIQLRYPIEDATACTGVAATCPVDECMVCSVRDCPFREPLHYHHDSCPACSHEP